MSAIIAKLLGWTKAPQWLLELILCLLVVAGIWYWHHSTYEAGIAAQQAKDDKANLAATIAANRETDKQRARADAAEKAHANERAALVEYQRNHPLTVRLCPATGQTTGHLPAAATAAGNAPGSSAASVQPVPAGDSGSSGVDIGGMLSALAASADSVSADLREHQSRE